MIEGARLKEANKNAVDAIEVMKLLYKHTHQVLQQVSSGIVEKMHMEDLFEYFNSEVPGDRPERWIYRYRGTCFAVDKKLEKDGINKKHVFFVVIILDAVDNTEPRLWYGDISSLEIKGGVRPNVRAKDYFKVIVEGIYEKPDGIVVKKPSLVEIRQYKATVHCEYKQLLSLATPDDVENLVDNIANSYGKYYQ